MTFFRLFGTLALTSLLIVCNNGRNQFHIMLMLISGKKQPCLKEILPDEKKRELSLY